MVEDGAHKQMSFLFFRTRQKRSGIVKLRVIRSFEVVGAKSPSSAPRVLCGGCFASEPGRSWAWESAHRDMDQGQQQGKQSKAENAQQENFTVAH